MTKIQKELAFLQNKANEAAGKLLNDERVLGL